ncbi:hypothetical protein MtrunA17_Chr8g0390641 [Medicago truncatula]|uniref:Uncharacterized protein n=1 Tax=Medicago truncatula TaxID=3880 RepID=A0A396GT31_MEDTR|nr:hypothetical protein MtrunA17_Chr8g0390641 [Medicago truncatula]
MILSLVLIISFGFCHFVKCACLKLYHFFPLVAEPIMHFSMCIYIYI